ncbi:hypothetical protein EYF80_062376 [Liparis tanakae]|uniref:Uncharacterized protein n=1 Tax=Liparis tanakae TaxID=230148 RepID=A0A4Z2EG20_9TELE|nr:hypothetical protein EYF80_062376 [Liparis tanakae]
MDGDFDLGRPPAPRRPRDEEAPLALRLPGTTCGILALYSASLFHAPRRRRREKLTD